jgi:hypothetical protein
MMSDEAQKAFPIEYDFLELLDIAADEGSKKADKFFRESGERLPASVAGLGTILSQIYRVACCAWGCQGGDHQIEWLTGRVVNQAMSAYRLIRAGYYDESLVLTRGIGEIANLLWLFMSDPNALSDWKSASRRDRLNKFGPGGVRQLLRKLINIGPPIDEDRYRKLCEIGTHPVPAFAPGHFTGSGRPILGVLLQPVGVYVSITELAFAVAMCAVAIAKLSGIGKEQRDEIKSSAITLTRSLGAFTILNYPDLLDSALTASEYSTSALTDPSPSSPPE